MTNIDVNISDNFSWNVQYFEIVKNANYLSNAILPYKAKRVYLHKKLKIINFLFFTLSSTTFYSASDGVILF